MSDAPPLRTLSMRIETGDEDLPEDRFNHHVNNARYFVFVNRAFQRWYREMGIRGGVPGQQAVMAHLEYDFLREVRPPAVVEVRLEVARAGRGRAVHVWTERASGRSMRWPAEVLARCWTAAAG
jgi:acyl-CoA thioesterase FadM